MRRKFGILLAFLAVLLMGCGKETPAETLPAATETVVMEPAAEETVPALEYAVAEVNGIPAVLKTLSRGDTVDVVEIFDENHYVVKLEAGYGLVEKNLLRLESEPKFEAWTGYAYYNAPLYDNYRLTGEPAEKLPSNGQVQVLEDLGWCLLVSRDGKEGYMKPETLAKSPSYSENTAPDSGNTVKPSGSEPSNGTTGEDGGEIFLRGQIRINLLSTVVPQQGAVTGKATVLADKTQVLLGYFDRGDRIPLVEGSETDGSYTVFLSGISATVSGTYLRMEGQEPVQAIPARTTAIAPIYEDIWMQRSPVDRLNAGTKVQILCELENCYLVEAEGVTGYMTKDVVFPVLNGDTRNETTAPNQSGQTSGNGPSGQPPSAPETEGTVPAVPDNSQTEGSSGESQQPSGSQPESGGNSGDSSGESSAPADPEWTPPIL